MRPLLIARKGLLEIVREPRLGVLLVLAPAVFLVVLRLGYGQPLQETHAVAVYDPDGLGAELLAELETLTYDDGRAVFDLRPVDEPATGDAWVRARDVAAVLAFEPGSAADGEPDHTLRGDARSLRYVSAAKRLRTAILERADRRAGRPRLTRLDVRSTTDAAVRTRYDIHAPGMLVFAILLIVPQTAYHVAREASRGTLRRLRMARVRAWELFTGVTLTQMAVATVQVPAVFGVAVLLGFRAQGSLLLGVAIALLLCFSAIGLGLLVVCFAQNDRQASSIGAAVMMAQVMVCGAFFPLPPMTVFRVAGHAIGPFDVFPATHGMLALQQVLSLGEGADEVAFRVGATLVLSLLYLAAGMALFHRLHLRGRDPV